MDTPAKSIWFKKPTKEEYYESAKNTAMAHCGVEVVEIGADFLKARMPVDERTKQPAGLLHGGMSVMLAESIASWAAANVVDREKYSIVGQEINANHIRSCASGWVYGTARPIYIGRTSHVWETKIENEAGKLICISRMTAAVLNRKAKLRNKP